MALTGTKKGTKLKKIGAESSGRPPPRPGGHTEDIEAEGIARRHDPSIAKQVRRGRPKD